MNEIKNTKKLIGAGVAGMAGLGVLGMMTTLPNMPSEAKTITPMVGAGVTLGMTAGLMRTAQDVMPKTKQTKVKRTSGDRRLDKMLGW